MALVMLQFGLAWAKIYILVGSQFAFWGEIRNVHSCHSQEARAKQGCVC